MSRAQWRLRLARQSRAALARIWSALRAASGDDAYERYRRHHAAQHAGAAPLSRRAFCAQAERAKWSGVNRCC